MSITNVMKNVKSEYLNIGFLGGTLLGLVMYYSLIQTVESISTKDKPSNLKNFTFGVSALAFLLTLGCFIFIIVKTYQPTIWVNLGNALTKEVTIATMVTLVILLIYLVLMTIISILDTEKSNIVKLNIVINCILDLVVIFFLIVLARRTTNKLFDTQQSNISIKKGL